jgi:hypothetical protein
VVSSAKDTNKRGPARSRSHRGHYGIIGGAENDPLASAAMPTLRSDFWPIADMSHCTAHVRFRGVKRTWPIAVQMSDYDPKRTWPFPRPRASRPLPQVDMMPFLRLGAANETARIYIASRWCGRDMAIHRASTAGRPLTAHQRVGSLRAVHHLRLSRCGLTLKFSIGLVLVNHLHWLDRQICSR